MFHTKTFKGGVLAATMAVGLAAASSAGAATMTGTFDINVYTYNAGGSAPNASATVANLVGKTLTANVTYTGDIDFMTNGNSTTLADFLGSGTGSYVVNSGSVAGQMTAGGFGTTSLFDITSTITGSYKAVATHDDGLSVYNNGSLVADSSYPTSAIPTPFNLTSGSLRMIYSAANGNPEQLNVQLSPVPVPAGGILLLSALGGVAALRRKKSKSA